MSMHPPPVSPSEQPLPKPAPGRWTRLLMASGRNDGPPDLDELWRDFNRKLTGLMGGGKDGKGSGKGQDNGGGADPGQGGRGGLQPDARSAGIGLGLIVGVAALVWGGSGFFIVQEGQQAIVTTFGRYSTTVDAGS